MTKIDEILSIQGSEEKLEGDTSEEQQEEKKPEKKKIKTTRDLPAGEFGTKPEIRKSRFVSTSTRSQPERNITKFTTRDLDADGKLIKKREEK